MKVTASIVMYSGMRDPEMEVSPEISQEIIEKLRLAYEESDKKLKSKLGLNGYMVIWHGGDGVPYTHIHVYDGIIAIRCFTGISYMKDTVGLEEYLKNLLISTLQDHINGYSQ